MVENQVPTDFIFEDSYVLRIEITPYILKLRMQFSLAPTHEKFHAPSQDEWAFYVLGVLRIEGFSSLMWEATGAPPAIDATGEEDLGCLDSFSYDNKFWCLEGDWGSIRIHDGRLSIEIDDVNG